MALIKCAECGKEVSSEAVACPHCGYAPTGQCMNCTHKNWWGCSFNIRPTRETCVSFKKRQGWG